MKKMKRIIALALMALSLFAVTAPATAGNANLNVGNIGIVDVNSAGLKIRKASPTDSTYHLVGNGTLVRIDGTTTSGGVVWYKVYVTSFKSGGSTHNGFTGLTGYASSAFINYHAIGTGTAPGSGGSSGGGTTTTPNPTGTLRNGYVNTVSGPVNLRKEPNDTSTQLRQIAHKAPILYYDGSVASTGSDGLRWVKIMKPSEGWIAEKYAYGSGVIGQSAPAGYYPYCNVCQNQMTWSSLISVNRVYNSGTAYKGNTLTTYENVYCRVKYVCAGTTHTPATNVIDGPEIQGWRWKGDTYVTLGSFK